jgi:hypothetical protein
VKSSNWLELLDLRKPQPGVYGFKEAEMTKVMMLLGNLLRGPLEKEYEANPNNIKRGVQANPNKRRRLKLDANWRCTHASLLLRYCRITPLLRNLTSSPNQQINHHEINWDGTPELDRVLRVKTLKFVVSQTINNIGHHRPASHASERDPINLDV